MKYIQSQRSTQDWQECIELLKQAVAEDKLEELLFMISTIEERNALALRVQVVRYLLEGKLSQRDIQKQLNTSIATVTRGSNMLKTVEPEMLKWVNHQLNDKD